MNGFRSVTCLRACAVAAGAALAFTGVPAQAADPTGAVLWTDAHGDAGGSYLDISQGNIDCADGNVTFQLSVPDLDVAPMGKTLSYQIYRMKWQVGSTWYFADAALGWSQSMPYVSFASGVYLPDGTPVLMNRAQGEIITGGAGLTRVTVRGADLQLPPAGSTAMRWIYGETLTYPFYTFFLGGPTPNPGGTVVDSGGAAHVDFDGGCHVVG